MCKELPLSAPQDPAAATSLSSPPSLLTLSAALVCRADIHRAIRCWTSAAPSCTNCTPCQICSYCWHLQLGRRGKGLRRRKEVDQKKHPSYLHSRKFSREAACSVLLPLCQAYLSNVLALLTELVPVYVPLYSIVKALFCCLGHLPR